MGGPGSRPSMRAARHARDSALGSACAGSAPRASRSFERAARKRKESTDLPGRRLWRMGGMIYRSTAVYRVDQSTQRSTVYRDLPGRR